jgi:hypothetical protein
MSHIVPRHTTSPRTSPGPRNPVPQARGRAEAHRRDAQRLVGTQAPGRCASPWSVRKPLVGAQAPGRCAHPSPRTPSMRRRLGSAPVQCQCSDPGLVLQAQGWCSGPGLVLWDTVGMPAHWQCSRPWSVPSAWAVRWCSASAPAPGQSPGPWPVPRRRVGTQAPGQRPTPGRCLHRKPRTGAQYHAILGPTRGCRRRQTASARPSLPLFAAPDPWRSALRA